MRERTLLSTLRRTATNPVKVERRPLPAVLADLLEPQPLDVHRLVMGPRSTISRLLAR